MNTITPPELPANGSLLDDLDYLNELKAALALDVTPQTLISYRKADIGPEFVKIGRRVYYAREKLKAWLEAGGTRQLKTVEVKTKVGVGRDARSALAAAMAAAPPSKSQPKRRGPQPDPAAGYKLTGVRARPQHSSPASK